MRFRNRRPEQPQGVRIEHANGEVTECEVVYEGKEDGVDVWYITTMMQPGDMLSVDVWPSRCAIQGRGPMVSPGEEFGISWREGGPEGEEYTARLRMPDEPT